MNSKIEYKETKLENVLILRPTTIYEDFRGSYLELYNKNLYHEKNIKIDFVQDDISISYKNVLRGIHGDFKTWKLITCLEGRIYLVVVNCKKETKEYGKWDSFTISEKNNNQVLVPPGYGVGHLVLSEKAIFHYKQSTYYNRSDQFTFSWDDKNFKIFWPINNPILSERDLLNI